MSYAAHYEALKKLISLGYGSYEMYASVQLVKRMPSAVREVYLVRQFAPVMWSADATTRILFALQTSMMARWSNVVRLPSALG